MSAPSAPPRLLCLPGYGSNASEFESSLAQLQRMVKGAVEFVFVEPPLALLPPNFDRSESAEANPSLLTSATPRASNNSGFALAELTALVRHLRSVLETLGPFDGIWGLNQGAATASILAALIAEPSLHPVFKAPSASPSTSWPPRQLKLAIMCSGYLPLDRRLESWFSKPLDAPSLHVLSQTDEVVIPERGLANLPRFQNARVEWTETANTLPRSATWSLFLKELIEVHLDAETEGSNDETR
ncbi:serine hydrolase FSH [Leucosporidium creatinivorum]|uniref:Serine hydrolase FSH n=1 Tax=Leucosporidium creatinivorum TaxID=106004 RepID=A0A1Y2ESP3_9BASI|nr:serine hydrolase FSH [Leucosporidium creatinivorum]